MQALQRDAHEKPSHFTFLRRRCEGVLSGMPIGVFPAICSQQSANTE
jgi:hypothetical protein